MEIIVSHNNTDLDGLASMVAAKKLYPEAELVYGGKLHRNVREFMALHKDTLNVRLARDIPVDQVERLILVDTKSPTRIGEIKEALKNKNIDIHIYDHHPEQEDDIRGNIVVNELVGATTTLLVEQIQQRKIPINSLEATIFALGIYEDTGCLTFSTTTARDAQAVAYLLAQGAKLSVVADFIGRPLTEAQKNLLNRLILSAETKVINGVKVLIATAEEDEYIGGLSLLTHKLLDIISIDVVFTVVLMDDRVHMVARSRIESVDVGEILENFGGGGHSTAASATVRSSNVAELTAELNEILHKKIKPEAVARDVMSAPVKTIPMQTTIEEAGKIMLRYGHTGMPVVDGDKMVGIISRRDLDKARHHGLGHAPVKGFMSRKVITVNEDTPLSDIQHLMIENNIGRLPVVRDSKLVGIVSRTDVLKNLHGDNYPERYRRVYAQHQANGDQNVTSLMIKNLPDRLRQLLGQISYLADQKGYSVFIVGGFVRDLLLGVENLDFDLVVEGDGIAFAKDLAEFLCGRVRVHDKFGTAIVILSDEFKIDVATARTEYYEYPAALPKVEISSLKQDLYRRDFTINAMAIALSQKNFGELIDFFGGKRDLEEKVVRVLYNLSFVEDPTRILRAVRFEQRYGFTIEPQTLALAKGAIKAQILNKLSADRVREELKHILEETSPLGAIIRMKELGIWQFVLPQAMVDEEIISLIERAPKETTHIKELGFLDIKVWLIHLALLVHKSGATIEEIDTHLRLNKEEQLILKNILACWEVIVRLCAVPGAKVSEIARYLNEMPAEGYVFLLLKLGDQRSVNNLVKCLKRMKRNKLLITGDDIKRLGHQPGPLFKEALQAAWEAKLDGLLKSREEELGFVDRYIKEREGSINH
ncbi:CBS domain-containing protein [Thermincola ferriacetica]